MVPVGWISGETRRCDRTRRGMAAILPVVCNTLHCVTSSFIPDFAADLRSKFTKTVTPLSPGRLRVFLLFARLDHTFFVTLSYSSSCATLSFRENVCPSVKISRDDYATDVTQGFSPLFNNTSVNVIGDVTVGETCKIFVEFCSHSIFRINVACDTDDTLNSIIISYSIDGTLN